MAIDSAEVAFKAAPHHLAEPALSRVDSTLRSIEVRMVGLVVNLEQGKPFSVLDERRRMLRRQPGRKRRIDQELDRTRRQIANLVETIVDGAAVDAEGTPIDAAYLDKSAKDEMRIADNLITEMGITIDFLEKGLKDLDEVIATADSAARHLSSIPGNP